MGTRSLTVIKDEGDNKEIVVMYRQFDGYPSEHGADLFKFLKGMKITNGISGDSTNTANGMGCLAAQIVQHFKEEFGVGGIYLHAAGTREVGEEYIYTISLVDNELNISCEDYDGKMLFSGTIDEFMTFCEEN